MISANPMDVVNQVGTGFSSSLNIAGAIVRAFWYKIFISLDGNCLSYPECESLALPGETHVELPESESVGHTPATPHPGTNVFEEHRYGGEVVEVAEEADDEGGDIVQAEADHTQGVKHLGAPGHQGKEEEQSIVAPVYRQVQRVPQSVCPHWQHNATEMFVRLVEL